MGSVIHCDRNPRTALWLRQREGREALIAKARGDRVDPASRLFALLDKHEPRIRNAFLAATNDMKNAARVNRLVDLLGAGRMAEAMNVIGPYLGTFSAAVGDSFEDTATRTGAHMRDSLKFVIHYDKHNERAVAAMRNNNLRLVREFTQEQTKATQLALREGIRLGHNPIQQARAFRDSIGLTPKQEQMAQNYRRYLEERDQRALARELRDKRFDRTIARALRDDQPLTRNQIDTMSRRYRERFVQFRSRVIARTEALRSVHQGHREMYQQAFESGSLNRDHVVRTWITSSDPRVRDSHSSMHGQERQVDEPFITGGGAALMYPGDPSGPAEDTIQCRCSVTTRISAKAIDDAPKPAPKPPPKPKAPREKKPADKPAASKRPKTKAQREEELRTQLDSVEQRAREVFRHMTGSPVNFANADIDDVANRLARLERVANRRSAQGKPWSQRLDNEIAAIRSLAGRIGLSSGPYSDIGGLRAREGMMSGLRSMEPNKKRGKMRWEADDELQFEGRQYSFMKSGLRNRTEIAQNFIEEFVDPKFLRKLNKNPVRVEVMADANTRAHATSHAVAKSITVSNNTTIRTLVHEFGHHLEYDNVRLNQRVKLWRGMRTKGEKKRKLSEITGNQAYDDWEVAKPDKFCRAYIGKFYSGGRTVMEPTEVVSMGLDMMYADPIKLATCDWEMFKLILGTLRGWF